MPLNQDTFTVEQPPESVNQTTPAALFVNELTLEEIKARLDAKGIVYEEKSCDPSKYLNGKKLVLKRCVNRDHRADNKSAVWISAKTGKPCHKCQSDDCVGVGFKRFLAKCVPEAAEPPLAVTDELRLARYVLSQHTFNGVPTLRAYRGEWYLWDGCWRRLEDAQLQDMLYTECKAYIMRESVKVLDKEGNPKAAPSFGKAAVANVSMALHSLVVVNATGWVDGRSGRWLAFQDKLLDLEAWIGFKVVCLEQTPEFFEPHALDYPLRYTEDDPTIFLAMLREQYHASEIDCIQEFGGYCMVPETKIQKALVMVGPTRSGKGTTEKTIIATIGRHNAASKTLEAFLGTHALEDLPGKTFLGISDSRPDPRMSRKAVERLLSITGEDAQNVNPKGKSMFTIQLVCKILLASNIVPDFADPTGALLARLLFVQSTVSKAGQEDAELLNKILSQQNEIAWWFLRGLRRLLQNGKYTEPKNTLKTQFQAKNNPVPIFINERYRVTGDTGDKVTRDELFQAFEEWCEHNSVGAKSMNVFFRELYAAFPRVKGRERFVTGLAHA